MKRFLLPAIFFFTLLLLFSFPFASSQVNAQTKGPLSCEEMEKVMDSPECPHWSIRELGMWCAQSLEEMLYVPAGDGTQPIWRVRPPDYTLLSDDMSCLGEDAKKDQPSAPPVKALKDNKEDKPSYKMPVFIGGWYEEIVGAVAAQDFFAYGWRALGDELIFAGKRREVEEEDRQREKEKGEKFWEEQEKLLNDEALWQFGVDPKEILERKPKINEADIDQLTRQTNQSDSPFSADIVKGQVQIKLPGQNEWSNLKQGDKIPPGSTIFTGVDTTTVLTIEGKGVVQVLSFTEITISEEGLKQAAKEQKTTTDIKLRKGEIEVNVESGVYPGTLQVQTPSVVAGVRGTHFWVSYNKDKLFSTVGVYEGEVEVKTKDGKTTTVSPDGDKPGVVVVAQKLSVVKLALAGLVLAGAVGSLVFFLKKKISRNCKH